MESVYHSLHYLLPNHGTVCIEYVCYQMFAGESEVLEWKSVEPDKSPLGTF